MDAFGIRFESELKGRSLWRGHYAGVNSPVEEDGPRDLSPELFPEECIEDMPPPRHRPSAGKMKQEPDIVEQKAKFDDEYIEFFEIEGIDEARDEFKVFL